MVDTPQHQSDSGKRSGLLFSDFESLNEDAQAFATPPPPPPEKHSAPTYVFEVGFDFEPDEGGGESTPPPPATPSPAITAEDILAETLMDTIDPTIREKVSNDTELRERLANEPALVRKLAALDTTTIERARVDSDFFHDLTNSVTVVDESVQIPLPPLQEDRLSRDTMPTEQFTSADQAAESSDDSEEGTKVFSRNEQQEFLDSHYARTAIHTPASPPHDGNSDLIDSLFTGAPLDNGELSLPEKTGETGAALNDKAFGFSDIPPSAQNGPGADGTFGESLSADNGPSDILASIGNEYDVLPPDDEMILGTLDDASVSLDQAAHAPLPPPVQRTTTHPKPEPPHADFSESFSEISWVEETPSDEPLEKFEPDLPDEDILSDLLLPSTERPENNEPLPLPENETWGGQGGLPAALNSEAPTSSPDETLAADDDLPPSLDELTAASGEPDRPLPPDDAGFGARHADLPAELKSSRDKTDSPAKLEREEEPDNILDAAAQAEKEAAAARKGIAPATEKEDVSIDDLFDTLPEGASLPESPPDLSAELEEAARNPLASDEVAAILPEAISEAVTDMHTPLDSAPASTMPDEDIDSLLQESAAEDRSSGRADTVELLEAGLQAEGMGKDTMQALLSEETNPAEAESSVAANVPPAAPDLEDEVELPPDIPLDAFGNPNDLPSGGGALDNLLDDISMQEETVPTGDANDIFPEETQPSSGGKDSGKARLQKLCAIGCAIAIEGGHQLEKHLDFKKNWGLYCDLAAAFIGTISFAVLMAAWLNY